MARRPVRSERPAVQVTRATRFDLPINVVSRTIVFPLISAPGNSLQRVDIVGYGVTRKENPRGLPRFTTGVHVFTTNTFGSSEKRRI